MSVVTLLLLWVITVPKRPESINNLKQLTDILNFVIPILDYKIFERIMQCFSSAAGKTPPIIKGAKRHKNTKKGGAPQEPPYKPQQLRKPDTASRVEFLELRRKQRVQQEAPEPSVGGMEDFSEILNLLKSGSLAPI